MNSLHFGPVEKARENVKTRWRKLKGDNDEDAVIEYTPLEWLADEDGALESAVSMHGKDWRKILDTTTVLRNLVDHLPGKH